MRFSGSGPLLRVRDPATPRTPVKPHNEWWKDDLIFRSGPAPLRGVYLKVNRAPLFLSDSRCAPCRMCRLHAHDYPNLGT